MRHPILEYSCKSQESARDCRNTKHETHWSGDDWEFGAEQSGESDSAVERKNENNQRLDRGGGTPSNQCGVAEEIVLTEAEDGIEGIQEFMFAKVRTAKEFIFSTTEHPFI